LHAYTDADRVAEVGLRQSVDGAQHSSSHHDQRKDPEALFNSSYNVVIKSIDVQTFSRFLFTARFCVLKVLNDLERRNGRYFALFPRIRVRSRRKRVNTPTSVSKSTSDSLQVVVVNVA